MFLTNIRTNNRKSFQPISMPLRPTPLLPLPRTPLLNRHRGYSLVVVSTTIRTILVFRVELQRAAAVAASSMGPPPTNHLLF